ncbi:MAG: hypothetical protein COT34_02790 [Candidatus Nealsonbacteria bacterium CG08_land_8_20_14_0_20_43_11]|uniref:Peptidase M10 metallopeptidase domain-containing protein n=1 Tax=Candidatus Nealsonbacteria bacterium CG08_land_8_20_14_0_20_43_11 TaxID=1974706 RepID=A0A2M6SZV2_9BACT|nr:MAG: hypothetical protein COT34_02790 [Candidatus Nealsonbacteria bacterium CG08_land_8_20_14_0_20_43_11]
MKKLTLIILVSAVLVLSGAALAQAVIRVPAVVEPSEQNVMVPEKAVDHSPALERIVFIHYKKGSAKGEAAKRAKAVACYKFLTPTKVKWTVLPVTYWINPSNPQGLTQEFITGAVFNSAEAWDNATSKELMKNDYSIATSVAYGVQDYKNAVVFGNYSDPDVIAVTSIWYVPYARRIVEFDIMFDTDYKWGDATQDKTKMDLQNIATHEFGHGVGLGDIYDSVCSSVTMYGYSTEGETSKRTLEAPDIKGLQILY